MPCNCGKKVERLDPKIVCSDCNIYFHASCVNLKESDVDFMVKSKKVFRCDRCCVLRRKSLSLNSSAINENVNLSQTNDMPLQNATGIQNDGGAVTLEIVYSEILKLKTLNGDALSLIRRLEQDKLDLQCRVTDLERKVNFLQQSKRKKFIEFVGVPSADNKNAVQSVIKICSDGLGVTVKEEDIEHCYVKKIKNKQQSAGSNNKKQPYHSNIICAKFCSVACKQNIMNKRFARKERLCAGIFGNEFVGKNIFINDSLSSFNRALFNAANKFKASNHYKYLWVRNSSILMRESNGKPVIRIETFEDLNNLVTTNSG